MQNKEIARVFQYLARLMELHGGNPYRIKNYQNVYFQLRRHPVPIVDIPKSERIGVKGVGDKTADKIQEILDTNTLARIVEYEKKTPDGVLELLNIKGIGPKKIRRIWKDLEVESIGELLYACNENRLIELKGFGKKTQDDLIRQLEYFQSHTGKYHFAVLEPFALDILESLRNKYSDDQIEFTGAFRRKEITLRAIEILLDIEVDIKPFLMAEGFAIQDGDDRMTKTFSRDGFPVNFMLTTPSAFGRDWLVHTGPVEFVKTHFSAIRSESSEAGLFAARGLNFIIPELRNLNASSTFGDAESEIIQLGDIKGVIHTHTNFSDGAHTVQQMAEAARDKGYAYLAISDHSKSAFYANGLGEDRIEDYLSEIDRVNATVNGIRVLKSIESDILSTGLLDYEEEILARFDLIIASVHSNLKMTLEKATARIITAVENPYTKILGHPTGRLLLARPGYPIDHVKVIDACARNGVAIELNANPHRLDLDWTWIPYAMEKNVKICINPDAHSMDGIDHIRYGVYAARKGGLTKSMCLNALNESDFISAISQ